ncbi:MAG: N-acetylneuraminate synthase family protein [Betaproteobacteria bacterium]|nr:MAG: N-acetylneuraminate synthase family protein [Betaproteobacteria bacterium]
MAKLMSKSDFAEAVRIGNCRIGESEPAWIIAEAGVNHNGDLKLALELVHAAKECGADCVKFQTFRSERIVTTASPKAAYQLETTSASESQYDMLKRLELDETAFGRIAEECGRAGITFLSTPYSAQDVDLLESIHAPAYKIASALAVEPLLLEKVASTAKPVLLSTGMCTMQEVRGAVQTLRNGSCRELIIFQCTTDYPSKLEEANLRVIAALRDEFRVPVGYSDHTVGLTAATAAVALGACAIERHFTLDRNMPGPDHLASSDPEEMRLLVQSVRNVEAALGSPTKSLTARETENKVNMRRGIVAARPLRKGCRLVVNDLAFKRPLRSIPPERYNEVVGCSLKRDLDPDEPISWDDLQ